METIVRNISDLPETDRYAAEQLVGHALTPDMQLVIVVQARQKQSIDTDGSVSVPVLPDWCNVYAGLSDGDIAEIEAVMLSRANFSRAVE